MIPVGKGERKAIKTLEYLNRVLYCVPMETENDSENVQLVKNIAVSLPKSMASKGVWSMAISDPLEEIVKAIVYFPEKSKIYPHHHNDIMEKIYVMLGSLHFKLYESDKHSKIIRKGILTKGDELFINEKETHYLFTCVGEVYAEVDFYKIK